ncbi:MAG: hypothetical protein IKZ12_06425 [Alistipes sp.]|nr:hypothetical protein [Alistipes sp.]
MAKLSFTLHISQQDYDDTIANRYAVLPKYGVEAAILQRIFASYSTFSYEDILLRSTLLNQFYSTAILDIRSMAEHIAHLPNVATDLQQGVVNVVPQIARVMHNGKQWNHTSFASKFASYQNNGAFPIMDSLVVDVFAKLRMLGFFVKNTKFSKETLRTNYSLYVDVYNEFVALSGMGKLIQNGRPLNYKEVDDYLWASRKIKLLDPNSPEAKAAPVAYAQVIGNAINIIP